MKIEIDKNGSLSIERKGKMKHCGCPNQQADISCGDWCPLFGEPEPSDDIITVRLTICKKTFSLLRKDFIDKRTDK